ncbi:MAG: nitrite/sulfite reductase [Alphaproteobacteria bacterium]|nr:nitrite/sulfite reductase [Alphaproteobacteria bacterium]
MYQYDVLDRTIVAERVSQFRDQTARRLAGELAEDEFRPLRLMNGLYLQLHAYMLRVAIPYGTLSSGQMRALAGIARRFDKGYGHFTTRQNIQYNWVKLEEAPDILAALAEAGMHAIQTSGNCIRNTTTDQFAGAAADELEDPRPWCELIRQWSTFHPEFSYLPRKFKIAVSGAAHDRAAVAVHDIGLHLVRSGEGNVGFRVLVGGGLGRTPRLARAIRDFLPKRDLLAYLEAIMRVYNLHGRRDNIFKARIKILVDSLGTEEFARQVEGEFRAMHEFGYAPETSPAEIARITAQFADPVHKRAEAGGETLDRQRAENPDFDRWVRTNVAAHKRAGQAIVTVSLKPVGGPPGDASAEQMDAIAELADRYSFGEIRTTHAQNLVLPHVREADLFAIWQALGRHGLATANLGLVSDIICCPGLDYCNLANTRSIPVAQRISERFADAGRQAEIGPLAIKMSGCINACGHHHVGDIGLLGVDKKDGGEGYQMTLGGRADEDGALGAIIGRAFSSDEVVDAVETVVGTYVANRRDGEDFTATYRRIGAAPFKESLYAADQG